MIKNGKVIDGTGIPWFYSDLGVVGDKIVSLDKDLKKFQAKKIIDAKNLFVCPGFIDIHTHSDLIPLIDHNRTCKLFQGIITELIGNCGLGVFPLNDKYREDMKIYLTTILGEYSNDWYWDSWDDYFDIIKDKIITNICFLLTYENLRVLYNGFKRNINESKLELIKEKIAWGLEFGYYLFRDNFDVMVKESKEAIERGFRLLKFKVGIYDYKDDIETVKVLREALGPDVLLFCDANHAWSIGTAIKVIKKMEDYDVFAVEQPTAREDLEGQKYIRDSVNIPISINEGVYTIEDAYNIISHGCADIIATDTHRPGGILEAKKLGGIAEAAKISVIRHSGGELGITTAAYLHFFASTPNFIYPNDSYYYHFEDYLIKKPFEFKGSYFRVPEKPGLGIELNHDKLEKYKSKETFNPFDDKEKVLKSEIPMFPKY